MRRQDQNNEWEKVTYMVFDFPEEKTPFAKRYTKMEKTLKEVDSKHIKLVDHRICKSKEDLVETMDKVCGDKGEGMMLRDPQSKYEHRRSDRLLKVKRFEDDEATVIGHERGSGRCEHMLGALRVKRCSDGQEFKIGSGFTDTIRKNPPKIGRKVTFKFMGLSNSGIPRFPIFMREHPGM